MPCQKLCDHTNGNLKAQLDGNIQKASRSQQRTYQAEHCTIPEPDSGRHHKQSNGVCDTPGDLPLPLPKGMRGTMRHAPILTSTSNRNRQNISAQPWTMTKTAGTAPTIQKYTTLPGETCQCTPQTSRTPRPTAQLNQKNGKIDPKLKFVTGTINPQETHASPQTSCTARELF